MLVFLIRFLVCFICVKENFMEKFSMGTCAGGALI